VDGVEVWCGVVASTSAEMHDGGDESRHQRYRLDAADTADLTVFNVTTDDAGFYTCSAYNGLGAAATESAHLSVTCEL